MAHLQGHNLFDGAARKRRAWRLGLFSAAAAFALILAGAASAGGSTSIATAPIVVPGAQESENTATDPTSQGAEGIGIASGCWDDLEYWRLPLGAGEKVVITGTTSGSGFNFQLAVFPPGTTSANISGATAVKSGFPSQAPMRFTAPTTGTYPVVTGPNCYNGADGPFTFVAAVSAGTASQAASVLLPSISRLPKSGSLTASVRTSGGSAITDSGLVLKLYGTWKDAPSAQASAHLLATAAPAHGLARFSYTLPASLGGTTVQLRVAGTGSGYRPLSSPVLSVTVA